MLGKDWLTKPRFDFVRHCVDALQGSTLFLQGANGALGEAGVKFVDGLTAGTIVTQEILNTNKGETVGEKEEVHVKKRLVFALQRPWNHKMYCQC